MSANSNCSFGYRYSLSSLRCSFNVFFENLKLSKRGELEIIDLLNKYRKNKKLKAEFIGRGGAWLDTGSIEDFYKTSAFVSANSEFKSCI